jgi:enoyl-CoA hydratase/carnithine racemase
MAVRLEKQDSIGHIVLDRPPANSYDKTFMEELEQSIDEAGRDDAVKAILLRSASEKFFSAGADVSVFARSGLDEQNAFVMCANEAMGKFESTPKVVVAAINGHCLGGGLEMALCCDFRIAAEGSYRIGLPEVSCRAPAGRSGCPGSSDARRPSTSCSVAPRCRRRTRSPRASSTRWSPPRSL